MARTERYAVQTVIEAIHRGHTALGAAQILGCHHTTVVDYAKRHSTVAHALRMERRALRDLGELSLRGAIMRGEGWAVMGVFKLFDEEGNGIPQNSGPSGKEGDPLHIVTRKVIEGPEDVR